MLTLKKIRTLKPRVQLRKVGSLLYQESLAPRLDDEYLDGLAQVVRQSPVVEDDDKPALMRMIARYVATRDALVAKDVYYLVLRLLGEEPADWDVVGEDGRLDPSSRIVRHHSLFLDRVRSPYNIGAVFRSAESFCVDHVYLRQGCGDLDSPRCMRTSRGTVDLVPHSVVDDLSVLEGRTVFALELGGTPIGDFDFPDDGICVLGGEEDGVSPDVLALCSSRVSIEQFGAKGSINVSVAAGILLHAWAMHSSKS